MSFYNILLVYTVFKSFLKNWRYNLWIYLVSYNCNKVKICHEISIRELKMPICFPLRWKSFFRRRTLCNETFFCFHHDYFSSKKKLKTRQVSSMIHSARPTVSSVETIVFAWNLFCFEYWGRTRTYRRTDGRTTCAKTMITTGRDFGLAEWIKNMGFFLA